MIQQADILAIRGEGWLSNRIVQATGGPVSHVGLILSPAPKDDLDSFVIEALVRVKTRPLRESIAGARDAWILSPLNVDVDKRFQIANRAAAFSADDYGWFDLGLQLGDALTKSRWFTRHLTFGVLDKIPICSYCVAKSYFDCGLQFGKLAPASITPADIYEFAVKNPDKFSIERIK